MRIHSISRLVPEVVGVGDKVITKEDTLTIISFAPFVDGGDPVWIVESLQENRLYVWGPRGMKNSLTDYLRMYQTKGKEGEKENVSK